MKEIIRLVIERLQKRQQAKAVVNLEDNNFDEKVLLHNRFIHLNGVSLDDLGKLTNAHNSNLRKWLECGIEYGCIITVQCLSSANQLISPSLITTWPVQFRDKLNKRLYAFKNRHISLADICHCEDNSVIILFHGQRFTCLANDEVIKRKIQVVEGNEKYAIS